MSPQNTAVIIVAAGSSRRMGFDKLMAPLGDSNVLAQTIQRFVDCPLISQIIVVTDSHRFGLLPSFDANITQVNGGENRHDSVLNGLNEVNASIQYIAVHDGARPLITPHQIKKTLQKAQQTGAATSARPITETLKRSTPQGTIDQSLCREHLWFMETPQIFQAQLLKEAYREVSAQNTLVTDEVSALELIGHTTHLVHNESFNPKITYPYDLQLAKALLEANPL